MIADSAGEAVDDVRWWDNRRLHPVPFDPNLIGYEVEPPSMFRPRMMYRPLEPFTAAAPRQGVNAWAYVVTAVPLPFIARSHFAFGSSYRGPAPGYRERGGVYIEGVTTCLCGVGVAIPIDTWSVGGMYH